MQIGMFFTVPPSGLARLALGFGALASAGLLAGGMDLPRSCRLVDVVRFGPLTTAASPWIRPSDRLLAFNLGPQPGLSLAWDPPPSYRGIRPWESPLEKDRGFAVRLAEPRSACSWTEEIRDRHLVGPGMQPPV